MYGTGFLIGVTLAFIFWLFVIAPGERSYHRKRLEIIREKLERIKQRKKNIVKTTDESSADESGTNKT